jgi:DHA1 family bicyclomycin/chloramphenicol resistance-like MFS transporter
LLLATQVNARLVLRYGPVRMLTAALIVNFIGAMALLINVLAGFGGLLGILLPVFICFTTVGAAPNNALALATEHYPRAAGSATALFGSLQFGVGALISIVVGLLHDGTAFPMAMVFATAATLSLVVNFGLAPRLRAA